MLKNAENWKPVEVGHNTSNIKKVIESQFKIYSKNNLNMVQYIEELKMYSNKRNNLLID